MAKILFHLEQDGGFPPIKVEILNATRLENGLFKIENAPFFAANVAYGDVVKAASTESPDQYEFGEVVEQSQFTSLSIIIMDVSMDTFLMDLFRGLGCVVEYGEFDAYRVLAVSIPGTTSYGPVREQLQAIEDRGSISFAELAVPKSARTP